MRPDHMIPQGANLNQNCNVKMAEEMINTTSLLIQLDVKEAAAKCSKFNRGFGRDYLDCNSKKTRN